MDFYNGRYGFIRDLSNFMFGYLLWKSEIYIYIKFYMLTFIEFLFVIV